MNNDIINHPLHGEIYRYDGNGRNPSKILRIGMLAAIDSTRPPVSEMIDELQVDIDEARNTAETIERHMKPKTLT